MSGEDRDWQRLDKYLWCIRVLRQRSDCAALAAGGLVRINRQPTDKPHAKIRVGDVITFASPGGRVRVIEVLALGERRGPASEARTLYREISEGGPAAEAGCGEAPEGAYRAPSMDERSGR